MITIINAQLTDIPVIQEIAKRTWPITFQNILSESQIDYMLEMMYSPQALTEQMQEKNHVFLLAKEMENSVGYISYQLEYTPGNTKIHKIYVLPNTQGKGIGKLLIDEVLKIAKQKKQSSLTLNVNRDNRAIRFYKHLDFKIVGEENIPIGNGFLMEDYIMEKAL